MYTGTCSWRCLQTFCLLCLTEVYARTATNTVEDVDRGILAAARDIHTEITNVSLLLVHESCTLLISCRQTPIYCLNVVPINKRTSDRCCFGEFVCATCGIGRRRGLCLALKQTDSFIHFIVVVC